MEFISKEQASMFVRNASSTYNACAANGYLLPEKKRCTAKFLDDVFR